jgi:hypothetical protein
VTDRSREEQEKEGCTERTKKPETKILVNTEDPVFTPADEDGDERLGGRKLDPLLLKISKPCLNTDGKKLVCCLASAGCWTTWVWPRAKDRISQTGEYFAELFKKVRISTRIITCFHLTPILVNPENRAVPFLCCNI